MRRVRPVPFWSRLELLRVDLVGATTEPKQRVADAVLRAIDNFSDLGIKRVADVCNARRGWLLATLSPDVLARRGLGSMCMEAAREELAGPFLLTLPESIVLRFDRDVWPERPLTPMSAWGNEFSVFMDAIDPQHLRPRHLNMSLAVTAFHELLHLAGDWAPDGDLRQT